MAKHVGRQARWTADRFYRGAISEAASAALSVFAWIVRARLEGKRIVAVDPDLLPERYEEPVVPGLDEALAQGWTWLVQRDHPWRRQLCIKGRKIAAGDLVRTMQIEGWTPEETGRQFDLPLEAVLEAERYAQQAADLIAAEEAENRIVAERYEQPFAAVR